LLDELLAGAQTEVEIVGPGSLLAGLTKRLAERAMEVELTDHLGYEHGQAPPGGADNTRNGSTPKTVATEHGPVPIDTPRDRDGTFEPKIVRKRRRRFEGFDEKIICLAVINAVPVLDGNEKLDRSATRLQNLLRNRIPA